MAAVKSFMKPVKFWSKSSTQSKQQEPVAEPTTISEEEVEEEQVPKVKTSYMPSFHFGSSNNIKKSSIQPALTESGKTEVYKLSTIDDTGIYVPPSPTIQGKRDHWIEIEEEQDFFLPSSECLTTYVGEKHDFYTPSTFVHTQPYLYPTISFTNMSESTLSSVPSLEEDIISSSCRSSASYA
jgi:hypothetical protein